MTDQLGMVLAHGGRLFNRITEFGLKRAEFIIIDPGQEDALKQMTKEKLTRYSAHCPMYMPPDYPENPLLASVIDFDDDRRRASVDLMIRTLHDASLIGAEYVVVHLQRPEHFGGMNPVGFNNQEALDSAYRSCERLVQKSNELKTPVFIENLMDNGAFFAAESYIAVLEKFPDIGFCIDLGHLDVDARKFGFSFDEFISALMPFTRAVHLHNSNTGKSDMVDRHWKIPVHPDQAPEDCWLDIEQILRFILGFNNKCIINFEARLDNNYDFEYMLSGIMWIKKLLPRILSEQS